MSCAMGSSCFGCAQSCACAGKGGDAMGMCHHNNRANYCPTCEKEKAMMNGQMGATDCQPGYYQLKVFGIDTGQCLPNLSTASTAAQTGVLASTAAGVANSPANIAAAQSAAANAIGTKIVNFYKNNGAIAYGATAVAAAMLIYGTMSFARGK